MSYSLVSDTDFAGIADTGDITGGAQVGATGWYVPSTAKWHVGSGLLICTEGAANETGYCLRGASEDKRQGRIICVTETTVSGKEWVVAARVNRTTNQAYSIWLDNGAGGRLIFRVLTGSGISSYPNGPGFTYTEGTKYAIVVDLADNAGGGTDWTGSIYDLAGCTIDAATGVVNVVATGLPATPVSTATVTGDTTSGLDGVAGAWGMTALTATGKFSRVLTYSATSVTASPSTLTVRTTGNVVTLTGHSTAWTSGTTFSLSGGTAASITAQSVNAGAQTASLTISTGTATGTLTVSNNTDAATCTITVDPLRLPTPPPGPVPVAGRSCYTNTGDTLPAGGVMIQTTHPIRAACSQVRICYVNYNAFDETIDSMAVKDGYSGTPIAVTWSDPQTGVTTSSVTVPAGGARFSDPIAGLTLAQSAGLATHLYVRQFRNLASDTAFSTSYISGAHLPAQAEIHDGWYASATDQTLTTHIEANFSGIQFPPSPIQIFGVPTDPTLPCLIGLGDSKTQFIGADPDLPFTAADIPGYSLPGAWLPIAASAFGIPYINISVSGTALTMTLADDARGRLQRWLLQFGTCFICFHGTNHFQTGTTAERDGLIANLVSLKALLPSGAPLYIATMTPHTTAARTVTLTSSGTTATGTVSGGHNLTTGTEVTVAGADQANYNGTFTVTVTNSTVFTYTMTGTAVSPATGTITETPSWVTITEAQQDLISGVSAQILDYNVNYVRATPGLGGSAGYFDFEDDTATSRVSMKWAADRTVDGQHQGVTSMRLMATRVVGQVTPTRRGSLLLKRRRAVLA